MKAYCAGIEGNQEGEEVVWGGHTELLAISRALNLKINVYSGMVE